MYRQENLIIMYQILNLKSKSFMIIPFQDHFVHVYCFDADGDIVRCNSTLINCAAPMLATLMDVCRA